MRAASYPWNTRIKENWWLGIRWRVQQWQRGERRPKDGTVFPYIPSKPYLTSYTGNTSFHLVYGQKILVGPAWIPYLTRKSKSRLGEQEVELHRPQSTRISAMANLLLRSSSALSRTMSCLLQDTCGPIRVYLTTSVSRGSFKPWRLDILCSENRLLFELMQCIWQSSLSINWPRTRVTMLEARWLSIMDPALCIETSVWCIDLWI